jgi:hypothetical protein
MRGEMADLTDLAAVVLARTQQGKLKWGALSSGGYYTKIGQNTITIDRVVGSVPNNFSLRFTNDQGKVVETVTSRVYDNLGQLYELARRQALQVDETLSTIKRALDDL